MNFVVKQIVRESDLKELGKIYSLTIQNEFPEYTPKTIQYFIKPSYRSIMLAKKIKLGAFHQGKIIGYLLANNPFGGVLFVSWIAVLKTYQGKGVGKKLLEKLEQIAKIKGAHSILLSTYKRDTGFYEKQGFENIGYDEKGYFGLGEYHMRKIIQEPKEENYLKY